MAHYRATRCWVDSDTMRVIVVVGQELYEASLSSLPDDRPVPNKVKPFRRNYSEKQKHEYVARCRASGISFKQFARQEGLSESRLSAWMKQYEGHGVLSRLWFERVQHLKEGGKTSAQIADRLVLPLEDVNDAMPFVDYEDYAAMHPAKIIK